MYIPVKLFFCIFALLVSVQHVAAEEWRGIVPLRSTREDVVRVFGECSDGKSECSFVLPNEEILIVFARDFCPEGAPPDTVLMIERQLQNGTSLSALGLSKRRFKTFNPWYRGNTDYRAYFDEKSGLLLKSFRGEIFQINYIPTKSERLFCRYYLNPKEFVRVVSEHVPYVNIRCPETTVAGDKIVITADYARTGERNLLAWHTTGGKIVNREDPTRLFLDTSGLEGQIITVTVERHNGNFGRMSSACTMRILPKPND